MDMGTDDDDSGDVVGNALILGLKGNRPILMYPVAETKRKAMNRQSASTGNPRGGNLIYSPYPKIMRVNS